MNNTCAGCIILVFFTIACLFAIAIILAWGAAGFPGWQDVASEAVAGIFTLLLLLAIKSRRPWLAPLAVIVLSGLALFGIAAIIQRLVDFLAVLPVLQEVVRLG